MRTPGANRPGSSSLRSSDSFQEHVLRQVQDVFTVRVMRAVNCRHVLPPGYEEVKASTPPRQPAGSGRIFDRRKINLAPGEKDALRLQKSTQKELWPPMNTDEHRLKTKFLSCLSVFHLWLLYLPDFLVFFICRRGCGSRGGRERDVVLVRDQNDGVAL